MIDTEPPEIVLLDYRLPRLDGLEVLRRIKAARSEIEVILRAAHLVGMSRETLRGRIENMTRERQALERIASFPK